MSEEEIKKTEKRLKEQIQSGKAVMDVKVDLLQYIRQQNIAVNSHIEVQHKFLFEDIEEQDCLLLQVPNINESGYYSGIVGLKLKNITIVNP